MKMKRVRVHIVFHMENETPYDIDINRLNPTKKQVEDIRIWVDKILLEEINMMS